MAQGLPKAVGKELLFRFNDGMPAKKDESRNLQDCFKHELLKHRAGPKKAIRQKLNKILPIYNNDVKLMHHMEISSELSQCSPGEELNIIIKHGLLDPDILSKVYTHIQSNIEYVLRPLNTLKIHPFGSFVTGLALQSSEFDVYIEDVSTTQSGKQYDSNTAPEETMYNRIDKILYQSSDFSHVHRLRNARVPIIKCKHVKTGFNLDINLACPSSVQCTHFLCDLMKFDQRLHELMVFLKVWAKVMQLIGRGSMSGQFVAILAIFYLQQEQPNRAALIPPIEKLQKDVEPETINGVNYAYNLQENMPIWPTELTTTHLIKGFFRFYCDFVFETELIAPYLGKTIPFELFKSGSFKYPAYENQSRAILILNNKKMADIEVENCVCVQDIFSLTHNVGKPNKTTNLEYFRRCIIYAYNFSSDPVKTNAQLYHAWLYEIVPCIAEDVTASNCTMENKGLISVARVQPTNSNGKTATTATISKNTVKVTNTITRTISSITSTIATSDITSSNPSNKNTNTSATNWITNITTTAKDSSSSPTPSKSDTKTTVVPCGITNTISTGSSTSPTPSKSDTKTTVVPCGITNTISTGSSTSPTPSKSDTKTTVVPCGITNTISTGSSTSPTPSKSDTKTTVVSYGITNTISTGSSTSPTPSKSDTKTTVVPYGITNTISTGSSTSPTPSKSDTKTTVVPCGITNTISTGRSTSPTPSKSDTKTTVVSYGITNTISTGSSSSPTPSKSDTKTTVVSNGITNTISTGSSTSPTPSKSDTKTTVVSNGITNTISTGSSTSPTPSKSDTKTTVVSNGITKTISTGSSTSPTPSKSDTKTTVVSNGITKTISTGSSTSPTPSKSDTKNTVVSNGITNAISTGSSTSPTPSKSDTKTTVVSNGITKTISTGSSTSPTPSKSDTKTTVVSNGITKTISTGSSTSPTPSKSDTRNTVVSNGITKTISTGSSTSPTPSKSDTKTTVVSYGITNTISTGSSTSPTPSKSDTKTTVVSNGITKTISTGSSSSPTPSKSDTKTTVVSNGINNTISTGSSTSPTPSKSDTKTTVVSNGINNTISTGSSSSTTPSKSDTKTTVVSNGINNTISTGSSTNTTVTNLNTSTTDTDSIVSNISSNSLPNQLVHNIYPVRTELRAIALHNNINDEESLHKLWIQYYTQAVVDVMTNIYCIDMESVLPTHGAKQQRLEDEELQRSWLLSGSVDVWTGRTHQRSRSNAMELQLAQTENFMRERRQQAAYSVNLCGKLTLNIVCNWKAIQLVLEPANKNNLWALCKKDPLRKLFLMFKNTMQNYNLKDTVLAGRFGVQGVAATDTENASTARDEQ